MQPGLCVALLHHMKRSAGKGVNDVLLLDECLKYWNDLNCLIHVVISSAYYPITLFAHRSAVDVYAPVVFQLIDKYFQPDIICKAVDICPAAAASETSSAASSNFRNYISVVRISVWRKFRDLCSVLRQIFVRW